MSLHLKHCKSYFVVSKPYSYVIQCQVLGEDVIWKNHDSEDLGEIQNFILKDVYSLSCTCGIPHKALLKITKSLNIQ